MGHPITGSKLVLPGAEVLPLSSDPRAGIEASIGSLGIRDNSGVGELWLKSNSGDSDWVRQGVLGNVLSYGADPTGISDSTSAIQTALNANSSVYIPAGSYRIDSAPISIPTGRRLYGDSCQDTELFSEQASDQLILIDDVEQVQISDLLLYRNTSTYSAYGNGIEIAGVSKDIVLKHIRVWNCFNQVQIGDEDSAETVEGVLCYDVRVDHNDYNALSAHYGFCLEWCKKVRLVDCSAKHAWLDGIKLRTYTQNVEIRGGEYAYNGQTTDDGGDGLDGVGGGDTFTIIGGDYHHNGEGNAGYGINLKAAGGDIGFDRNVTIIAPRCYSNYGPGLVINRSSAASPDNPLTNMISVYGGFYYLNGQGNSPGCGVYVRGRNISMHGLMVRDNDEQGVDVQAECYDVNLHGIVCVANGTSNPGVFSQLTIRGKRTNVFGGIFNGKNDDTLKEDADYAGLSQIGGLGISVGSTAVDTLINQPIILNPSLVKGIDVDAAAVNSVIHRTGSGSPEGVYEGGIGSTYTRNDGSQGTGLYVRESGAPNTKVGWRSVSSIFDTAQAWTKNQYSPPVILDSLVGVIDYAVTDRNTYKHTVDEDAVVNNPSGLQEGMRWSIEVIANGSNELTWGGYYDWSSGGAPDISMMSNGTRRLLDFYASTSTKIICAASEIYSA